MAYGARLESVLGASPRGFESPILRQVRMLGARQRPTFGGSNPPFSAKTETPAFVRAFLHSIEYSSSTSPRRIGGVR